MHNVFREHPSLCSAGDVAADEAAYNTWRAWCRLQWDTYCMVSEHLQHSESSGIHAAATPSFTPPPALEQQAHAIGAKWTQSERTPEARLNPAMALALRRAQPIHEQVCALCCLQLGMVMYGSLMYGSLGGLSCVWG